MYVYIMVRSDGWHKIGLSADPQRRTKQLAENGECPRVVRTFRIGRYAPTIENVAHFEMGRLGVAKRQGEWFESDANTCAKAIVSAKRKMAKYGGYDGLRKHVQKLKARVPPREPGEPSDGQLFMWERQWFSPEFSTDESAARRTGFTAEMCRRRWGSSGRPWPKRRRKS
jgi:hypothetical protein